MRRRLRRRARSRGSRHRAEAISVCSGSALWGSMMAAGLTAQEMVDQSLNWQPEDYLDIQWTCCPPRAGGDARLHRHSPRAKRSRSCSTASSGTCRSARAVPIYSQASTSTSCRLEVFGSKLTPDLTVGELVRIAIALPLLSSPCAPRSICSRRRRGRRVRRSRCSTTSGSTSWSASTRSCRAASRGRTSPAGPSAHGLHDREPPDQLRRSSRVRPPQRRRLGRKLILIDPIDFTEVHGWRFYDLFIDRRGGPPDPRGLRARHHSARPLPPLERRPQAPQSPASSRDL